MKDYFFCYNKVVSDYLRERGLRYITVAKDINTNKSFSLYEINDEFQKIMDEYRARKN